MEGQEGMKELLSQLVKEPLLEFLELSLRTPNFFSILKVERKEIRHSNFLAWLLSPQAGHGLGDTFLKWFLRDIFSDERITWADEFEVDSLNLTSTTVLREWRGIDLLIVTPKFVVCVENKVASETKPEQLERYEKIIRREFEDKNRAFVLLRAFEDPETEEELPPSYILYSYEEIKSNIERILRIYKDSLPLKARFYIEDYLTVLRREIMKEDDELVKTARKIYQNHREALEFIFEHKPDRLLEVTEIATEAVKEMGFIPGSINKGYVRFLTRPLSDLIPRTGSGWKGKESFLFELDLWPKHITLKAVISPGDERVRAVLKEALSSLNFSRKPRGKKWLIYFSKTRRVDLTDDNYDDEKVKEKVLEVLKANQEAIEKIQQALLERKEELIKLKGKG